MDRHIVGIDPGRTGGIARIAVGGERLRIQIWPMPIDNSSLMKTLTAACDRSDVVVMEKVGQINLSRNHSVSFGFGKQLGRLETVLDLLGVTWETIPPPSWHAAIQIKKYGPSGKQRSIAAARALFPGCDFIPPGKRSPHDGCAEAALIALGFHIKEGKKR